MPRIDARRWLLLGLAAFALRGGVAVLTEYKPLFPDYYYHDAVFAETMAADMARAWKEGRPYRSGYSAPQRVHALCLAAPYMIFGPHPLVDKLLNCLLGACSIVFFGMAAAAVVSPQSALAAGAMAAVWPSHIFYTSQNFKESPTFFLFFGALAMALHCLDAARKGRAGPASAAFLAAGFGVGLLRSYVLMVLCFSVSAAAAWAARRARSARLILAAALLTPLVYKGLSPLLFTTVLATHENTRVDNEEADFVRGIPDEQGNRKYPLSPQGISEFRRLRQAADRSLALHAMAREIGTQIYPDVRFETWLDVALFMPKAAFHVLFMPLPGLYPMDGKLGRMLASAENVFLLAVFAAALWSFSRASPSAEGLAFVLFFLLMAGGTALLEFDLGSASRHKLIYFPMLFPFAAEELLRRRRA